MADCIFIYITTSSRHEAEKIGHVLVEEQLVACANIIPHVQSIYRWQGAIENAQEVVLIVKTVAGMFDAVAERVKVLHSATTPCIVALPIVDGTPDFLAWIKDNVLVFC